MPATQIRRARPRIAIAAALAAAVVGVAAMTRTPASAHGSASQPPSRVYQCRFNTPQNPMCALAWNDNAQAMWDWMGLRIGDADGRHQQLIPDGKLCSANQQAYAAFDRLGDQWPATVLTPNAQGRYHLEHEATAPHATAYFRWYITRTGYDLAQPLKWSDLTLVHDSGPLPAMAHWHVDLDLSAYSGRRVMYLVWQRSDSPEAFYGCSDVILGSTPPSTTTSIAVTTTSPTTTTRPSTTTTRPSTTTTIAATTTTRPATTTTTPPTTSAPTTTAPSTTTTRGGRVTLALTTTSQWSTGHCAQGVVTNGTSAVVDWKVQLRLAGAFTSTWDGTFSRTSTTVTVSGAAWNKSIAAGTSRSFGYCAAGAPGTSLST